MMTEMADGWVEVAAVHDPTVSTRFEKKNPLHCKGQESESRIAAAKHIWYPTRSPLFPVNRLPKIRGLA